jgi:hypothetical protein
MPKENERAHYTLYTDSFPATVILTVKVAYPPTITGAETETGLMAIVRQDTSTLSPRESLTYKWEDETLTKQNPENQYYDIAKNHEGRTMLFREVSWEENSQIHNAWYLYTTPDDWDPEDPSATLKPKWHRHHDLDY